MENIIKDESYYIIHGWIKNRLGLKGIKRDIFAIIYGFSQDGESEFKGSIKYFEEWLDVSRPTIIKALHDLTESGFIIKRVENINGVQFNRYKINLQVVKNFNWGGKEILLGGSKEILPNKEYIDKDIKNIINYLNAAIGTKYRYQSKLTQRLINARFKEGYMVDDFKTVIDKKAKEWKGTEMEQFLRPETLFGTKFESYLNAPIKSHSICGAGNKTQHFENEREYSTNECNNLLKDIDDINF